MSTPEQSADPVVILGTGLAGYTLAREFRKLDKTTPLTLISADHGGFYSKPMLSNALASGKNGETLIMKSAAQMSGELGATVLAGTTVVALDTTARTLTLQNGQILRYRDLVFATGADPIRLPLGGNGAGQVLSVNNVEDFSRFAEALAAASARTSGTPRVVVLGAGLIGCEFANDLLARGIRATVVDPGPWPLGRLLPEAAGSFFRTRLESAGVNFQFGTAVESVSREEDGSLRLSLTQGGILAADVVLSAVGLRPRVNLAQGAGLRIGRGILVDRQMQTSQAHVFALGDAAEVCPGVSMDPPPPDIPPGLVLPFVLPIMQQAKALAASLAGQPTPVSYPVMPVVVKTPACPTVVSPPPGGASGNWTVSTTADGLRAIFADPTGQALGFALLGDACGEKQKLAQQLPPTLPAPNA